VSRDESIESPAEAADDFLYHLYRGSELLLKDQVHEAKGELERALALQPQDAKGQDLLAGVYFRLGVYPRAIEIWRRLVEAYAKDGTLKVNLALALVKTGQNEEALGLLIDAVTITPDHEKAWGYLGLTYWRLERFKEARDAFLRGGQASMARRMEAVLSSISGEPERTVPVEVEAEPSDRAAMRSAAEQAIEQFEAAQVPLSIAPPATRTRSGAWRVAEPGEPHLPRLAAVQTSTPNAAAPSLETRLVEWTLSARDDSPLSIGPGGELFVSIADDGYCRMEGLIAVRGELRMAPVKRRVRSRELETIMGEERPIMRLRGPVAAVVAPDLPGRFYDFTMADDVLFVREDLVWGFDGRLGYESGLLPAESPSTAMLSLHGSGVVILRLDRAPCGVAVDENTPVSVDAARLVGWSGRLLPSTRRSGTVPYGAVAPPLSFRGDGVVLVA